jgi:hypothetical protein
MRRGSVGSLYQTMSLTGSGLQIKDARVRLARDIKCKLTGSTPGYGAIGYSNCVNRVPFALGTDLLSRLRIYISLARKTVYISTLEGKPAEASGTLTIGNQR